MIVRFFRDDDGYIGLQGEGCGCCSEYPRATRENIIEAIEDHRKFIQELEELLKEVECQPSQP